MNNLNLKIALLFVSALVSQVVYGQQKDTLCIDKYVYYVPGDLGMDQAKHEALKEAKSAALSTKYGTIISQSSSMFVKDSEGEVYENFVSFLGSEEKGEWIADLEEPEFNIGYGDEGLVVTVSVCGLASKINSTYTDLQVKLLCNGTEPKFENDIFNNNDDFYISFRSPQSGYVAVYLTDESSKVYRLLPYSGSNLASMPVIKDTHYIFFSPKHANDDEPVDELVLTCTKPVEFNRIHVVFSPRQLVKANDTKISDLLPSELTNAEFQQWLAKNRSKNSEITVVGKDVMIKQ